MDAGSMFLYPGPFRPIPLYGHRPMFDLHRFPAFLHTAFHPYLGHPSWKSDDVRSSLELYSTSSRIASYNLYLQEHLKRLHDTRHPLQTFDGRQQSSPETTRQSPLVAGKDPTPLPHHPMSVLPCPRDAHVTQDKNIPLSSTFGESLGVQYNMGRKVFPCPQCRYTTDRRNNLKRHMLTMHQTCPKLLECCGILFSTKASLREHAMIFHYHGYTCYYCGRRFCRKALLKRHLSVHNGQKDFVCAVCDYATSHKSNLERHRKVHMRQEDMPDDLTSERTMASNDDGEPRSKNRTDETGSQVDAEEDEVYVCSETDEDDEEINVHCD